MRIDEKRLSPILRPAVLKALALIALALLAVLPVVSLVSCSVGLVVYFVCLLVPVAVALCGFGVGILIANEAEGGVSVVGFFVSTAIGVFIALWLWGPLSNLGEGVRDDSFEFAEWIFVGLFLNRGLWIAGPAIMLLYGVIVVGFFVVVLIACLEDLLLVAIRRNPFQCPDCNYNGRPWFRCGGCSNVIENLRPTRFGLFSARCAECGHGLPTTNMFGRWRLEKLCPASSCGREHGAGWGRTSVHAYGLVGSASSGKSRLMLSMVDDLLSLRITDGWAVEVDRSCRAQVHTALDEIRRTGRQEKTRPDACPPAVRLNLHDRSSLRSDVTLDFYDVDGGQFESSSGTRHHHHYKRASGVVFVLDPFAESGLLALSSIGPDDAKRANPAKLGAREVFESFIGRLEEHLHRSAGSKFPVPLAVVVSKLDQEDIGETLGIPIQSFRDLALGDIAQMVHERSSAVRHTLIKGGLSALIGQIEERFSTVCYFPVSTGAPENGRFQPVGTSSVLAWLLHQSGLSHFGLRSTLSNLYWTLGRTLAGIEGERAMWSIYGILLCVLCVVVTCLFVFCSSVVGAIAGILYIGAIVACRVGFTRGPKAQIGKTNHL